jgi:hypothetical protein
MRSPARAGASAKQENLRRDDHMVAQCNSAPARHRLRAAFDQLTTALCYGWAASSVALCHAHRSANTKVTNDLLSGHAGPVAMRRGVRHRTGSVVSRCAACRRMAASAGALQRLGNGLRSGVRAADPAGVPGCAAAVFLLSGKAGCRRRAIGFAIVPGWMSGTSTRPTRSPPGCESSRKPTPARPTWSMTHLRPEPVRPGAGQAARRPSPARISPTSKNCAPGPAGAARSASCSSSTRGAPRSCSSPGTRPGPGRSGTRR